MVKEVSKNFKAKWFYNGLWYLPCNLFYWLCHAATKYENLKPLENHTEVFEGKKPEWVEVLSRKIELEMYKEKK